MRVLLVGPDFEENLSIRYLSAALLDAGYQTALASFNSPADLESVAEAARDSEVVGLSMCFQARAQEFLGLAQAIKRDDPNKLIVAGGHYASCAAEPLLANHPAIDIVVTHEGERTLVEIVDAIPAREEKLPHIAGIAYRDGGKVRFTEARRTLDDLDCLPFPDRRGPIHTIAGVPTSYLMGSRGCYGSCAYCCITSLHRMAPGKRFRQRNVERIAEEMELLHRERGTRQFVFHDDNFLVPSEAMNRARISALEHALNARGIQDIALVIKCRPADANREVLRQLKNLGLVRVFLGIESATAQGLSDLERRQSVEDSVRALEICAELEISAQFTIMIFHPDATLETMRADAAFMRRFCGNPLNFCRAEIYAGTPLETRMIETGRARGNYLARVYDLSDPVAELACKTALDLFEGRCWSTGSLMQNAIGLDHSTAVFKRFHCREGGPAVAERVGTWLRAVNLDTIQLLEEVIERGAGGEGTADRAFQHAMADLRERESRTRRRFLAEASRLRAELEGAQSPRDWPAFLPGASRMKLATKAAVAVLAFGMPVSACNQGVSEMAPPPLQDTQKPVQPPIGQESLASVAGTVTDSMKAVVGNAPVTVTNLDTGLTRTLKTDSAGHYEVKDLPSGRYNVKVEMPGFKTTLVSGIVLQAGERKQTDVRLEIGDIGCCEYAAIPLKPPEEFIQKKKPFTYIVGEGNDDGTLPGIARLVYGDKKKWVQIFEANRNVIPKPEVIRYGTELTIPRNTRNVPKLLSKLTPVYPPDAAKQGLTGDVVLDVTLNDDGTVAQVNLIDGQSPLAESAVDAVKHWRYRPLIVKGKPVRSFVVVVTFSKAGKISVE